jgi:hypothetical protein
VSSLRRRAAAPFAGVLLAAGLGAAALAGDDFVGSWLDNIAGEMSIGTMTVKPGTIEFKRAAHYSVIAAGSFGAGDLFKVTGVNKPRDPMGCGPNHRVTYIAITPLPPLSGTTPQSVKVLFFTGDSAPDPSTYKDGPFLCDTHPFDRAGSN